MKPGPGPRKAGQLVTRGAPQTDADHLLYLLGGKHRAQALSTAAALGIADHLARSAPTSAEALAAAIGCHASDLESLLRLLAGLEFVAEPEPGLFALTTRGHTLRREELGALADFVGTREQWDPWSRLRESMRKDSSGIGPRTPAFARAFGCDLYEHLANDAAASERYDRAIDAFTRHEAHCMRDRLDLASARCIVDVGGGRGTLLLELLAQWPNLRGVLLDLPHVIDGAGPRLAAALPGRIDVVAGDFFNDLPAGGDLYLIKHVLHNWDDEYAELLLARCADVMAPQGRVVVIDAVLAPDNRPDLARLLDLEMRVLTGGRERRKPELRRLFRAAGLTLDMVEPLTAASWLLVGGRRTKSLGVPKT